MEEAEETVKESSETMNSPSEGALGPNLRVTEADGTVKVLEYADAIKRLAEHDGITEEEARAHIDKAMADAIAKMAPVDLVTELAQKRLSETLDNKLFPKPVETKRRSQLKPIVNNGTKIGRNEPCPCGRGKKFKDCCMINLPKTRMKKLPRLGEKLGTNQPKPTTYITPTVKNGEITHE